MIYTVTVNPALDRTILVDRISKDDVNRILTEERYAGGKGIDASRVLKTLGLASTVLGFAGGFTGDELLSRLMAEGIRCDFVRISGETRTNIVINVRSGGQYLFSGKGPVVKEEEVSRFIEKIKTLKDPEFVLIGGSLPPGTPADIYRRIIEAVKRRGARVLLDSDGEAMREGLKGRPHFIKPNVHELSRLVGRDLQGLDEIIEAARKISEKVEEAVLVSMGAGGILFVEGGEFLATPPPVEVVNTVGAGDSAVAGFVYGLINGGDYRKALASAVAAGTATTLRPGTALCTKEDFERILPRVWTGNPEKGK